MRSTCPTPRHVQCLRCKRMFKVSPSLVFKYCSRLCKAVGISPTEAKRQISHSRYPMQRFCTACGKPIKFLSEARWNRHSKVCSGCYLGYKSIAPRKYVYNPRTGHRRCKGCDRLFAPPKASIEYCSTACPTHSTSYLDEDGEFQVPTRYPASTYPILRLCRMCGKRLRYMTDIQFSAHSKICPTCYIRSQRTEVRLRVEAMATKRTSTKLHDYLNSASPKGTAKVSRQGTD